VKSEYGEKIARGEEKAKSGAVEMWVMVMGLTAVTISGEAKKFTTYQLTIRGR